MSEELIPQKDVRVAPIAKSFDEMMKVADTLLKSGFLPYQIKSPAQAVAIILMGREVGLPEMQALRSINVIQGKPTMSAELMLALFSSRVNGEAKIEKSDDTECIITFKRPGRQPHVRKFTIEDARRLGFVTKDNYTKQPGTMLQWRCVSAGLRFYAPDALAGISYTPDELGARVDLDTGEVLDLADAQEVPPDDVPAIDVRADSPLETSQTPPSPAPASGEIAVSAASGEERQPTRKVSPENFKFVQEMSRQKRRVGRQAYYSVLGFVGSCEHASEITDRKTQMEVYQALKSLPDEKAEQGELLTTGAPEKAR